MIAQFLDERLPERFWSKVIPEPNSGCWLWLGAHSFGYGFFSADGKVRRSHRFAFESLVGSIPDGLHLDHLCRTRCCVNPAHLEPVTSKENTLRGVGVSAANAQLTTCKWGHPLDGDNVRIKYNARRGITERACRACHRRRNLEDRIAQRVATGGRP